MKKFIMFLGAVFTTVSFAGGTIIQDSYEYVKPYKEKYFFNLAGGFTKFNIESKLSNGSFNKGALDDKGYLLETGLGYSVNNKTFLEFNYQYNKWDIAKIHNFYTSINYKFNSPLNLYTGFVLGYSKLKWSKRPYVVMLNEKLNSSSALFGIQIGSILKINKNIEANIKYQLLKSDHVMDIKNNTNSIKHNLQNNLVTGVRYAF